MNIAHLLAEQSQNRPAQPAIVDFPGGKRRVLSFSGLEDASAQAAFLLHQSGLRAGDVALVFQPMSAELYIALAAIFRLGLVAMFVDPGQGLKHIEQCCAIQRPRALIASDKAHLLRLVSPALRRIPLKFCIGMPLPGAFSWNLVSRQPARSEIFPAKPDSPALLTFTSGSTGQPKAALRTHGFLLAQHRALSDSLALTPGDTDLSTMPIVLLSNLAHGVSSLIPPVDLRSPGRIDPSPLAAVLQSEEIVSTVASPALLEKLAVYGLSRHLTFPGLRKVFTGGAPVFPKTLALLQQMAPQAEIFTVYGSTEAEPIAKIPISQVDAEALRAMLGGAGLLVGAPVESIRLAILPDAWGKPLGPYTIPEFDALRNPAGVVGEIVVNGEHVLPGYLRAEGDSETKFRVDDAIWHRTGDAGYLDARGRLWLMGRCAARVQDERGTLYPFAVECAASQFPGLRRSALLSHAGRRVLVVEPDGAGLDAEKLQNSLAWAGLDEIRPLAHIPVDRRHNAKVDYPALRRRVIGR